MGTEQYQNPTVRQIQTRKEVQLVFNEQQNFERYCMCRKQSVVGVDYFGSVRHLL